MIAYLFAAFPELDLALLIHIVVNDVFLGISAIPSHPSHRIVQHEIVRVEFFPQRWVSLVLQVAHFTRRVFEERKVVNGINFVEDLIIFERNLVDLKLAFFINYLVSDFRPHIGFAKHI